MPDVTHSSLGAGELHEPKGVAAATSNQTYVADGVGSGSWSEPEPKGAGSAAADDVYVADGLGSGTWQKPVYMGFTDYNDAASGSVSFAVAGTWYDLPNDGAGSFTNLTYKLPGAGDIWNTTSDQFEWDNGGLSLGDTVHIRIDVDITTTGANAVVDLSMDLAHGTGSEYKLVFKSELFKSAGTYNRIIDAHIYMGDSATLNNPAKIAMKSDTAGDSVTVNGWFTETTLRTPKYE